MVGSTITSNRVSICSCSLTNSWVYQHGIGHNVVIPLADKPDKLYAFDRILQVCSACLARPWTSEWWLDQISREVIRVRGMSLTESPLYTMWSPVGFNTCMGSVCPAVGTAVNAVNATRKWETHFTYFKTQEVQIS